MGLRIRNMKCIGYLSLLPLVWLCSGCFTSGGGTPMVEVDTVPPVVSDFTITAPASGWRAGPCRITLRASDDKHIAKVVARISGPSASGDPVILTLVSGSKDQYQGDGPVPANTNNTGKNNTYYVTAWAQDDTGNSTAVAQSLAFTVPPPDVPGPPPSAW